MYLAPFAIAQLIRLAQKGGYTRGYFRAHIPVIILYSPYVIGAPLNQAINPLL